MSDAVAVRPRQARKHRSGLVHIARRARLLYAPDSRGVLELFECLLRALSDLATEEVVSR
jgi:hypothetical protein